MHKTIHWHFLFIYFLFLFVVKMGFKKKIAFLKLRWRLKICYSKTALLLLLPTRYMLLLLVVAWLDGC